MRQVCAFLGEDYEPAMLSMCGSPRQREKMAGASDAASGQSPLSTEFIGGFRHNVPDFDIAFIQAAAGNKMNAYGYAAEPIRFSTRDRLRFALLHWPVNLVRMAAWRGREAMHNRRPSQFGFRPDRKATVADPAGSRDAVQAA